MLDYEVTELNEETAPAIRSVLIIEDHELIRESLQRLVARICARDVPILEIFQVATLAEAQQNLAHARNSLDLIILDLHLPDADPEAGLALLEGNWRDLPVLVVSGDEDWSVALRFMQAGALGFIPKRSPMEIMENALRLIFAGGRYFPDEVFNWIGSDDSDAIPSANLPAGLAGETVLDALTPRQREVLALMTEGRSNKEIARELQLSVGTAKNYVASVMRAFGVNSRMKVLKALDDLQRRAGHGTP